MTGLEIGVGVVGGLFYIYKLATGVKNTNKSASEPLSEWLDIYERTSPLQKPAMAYALTTVGINIGAISPHDKATLMSEAKRGDYSAMLDYDPNVAYQKLDQCLG